MKDRITLRKIKKYKHKYLMLLPATIFVFVFFYMPIWGMLTAFFDYNPGIPLLENEFVGFENFIRFFNDPNFFELVRNTVAISFLNIVFGTVFPITFAILLNELVWVKYKKVAQTISYLPHFISYVVVSNIVFVMLAPSGQINELLLNLNFIDEPINFMTEPNFFWWLIAFVNIWKEMGWSAIIYIAAIANIDMQLYEAAMVDGAGRFRRIFSITIPQIAPTIVVLLILAVPNLLNAGFDPSYLLGNAMVADYSEVIDTYIYRVGLNQAQYSYATAIGLIRQVIGLCLIFGTNAFARRVNDYSLY